MCGSVSGGGRRYSRFWRVRVTTQTKSGCRSSLFSLLPSENPDSTALK
jgi:hypothetical protein